MTLSPGSRLGPYEILAALGAGGMGEVYRARDSKLDRDVAIKILPEAFAGDPERVARFHREAKTLASLNHPNIGGIYGFEEAGGVAGLVLELVEGETLAQRIEKGPLPLEQVLRYAVEITAALDTAHRHGIVHRDLKPANIMLTKAGVKLLDFGLAKLRPQAAAVGAGVSAAPTQTGLTGERTILGTLQYMAPEQLEGHEADARTDLFAVGAIVYEMATGTKAFVGQSPASVMAKILQTDPPPLGSLQPLTPPGLERLVSRCLAKDPDDRWQTARDLWHELKWISQSDAQASGPGARPATGFLGLVRPAWGWAAAAALVFAVLGVVAGWTLKSVPLSRASTVSRFVIPLPPTDRLDNLNAPAVAISPDGTRLAYVASRGGTTQLYLRPIDSVEGTPIADTREAVDPFFSPDSQWIGFFAGGRLRKVSVTGGAPVTLAMWNSSGFGAHWGSDDAIVVTASIEGGLWTIPAAGGVAPHPLTKVDAAKGELGHHYPDLLPGGNAVLFTVPPLTAATWDDAAIVVQSLDTGARKELIRGGTAARYVSTGHLVYMRAGQLMAVPFDLERLEVTGTPVPLADDPIQSALGAAQFSVSRAGDLVYVPGGNAPHRRGLAWVDREGHAETLPLQGGPYVEPRLAPDGRRIALRREGPNCDVLIFDVGREALTRFTIDGDNHFPLWTPDGERIIFQTYSTTTGQRALFWQPADGRGAAERLIVGKGPIDGAPRIPGSVSPDGTLLAFSQVAQSSRDIWVLPLAGDRQPRPFLQTAFNEGMPRWSPDGRWLAYVSDQSGRMEVYVVPFPGPGARWQASTDGGAEPVWSPDGRELFYRTGDRMMAVDVTTAPSFSAGRPRLLFQGTYVTSRQQSLGQPEYDVTPDGRRFLMLTAREEELAARQIMFVQNWFEELRRLASAN